MTILRYIIEQTMSDKVLLKIATCEPFSIWRPSTYNPWRHEIRELGTFRNTLDAHNEMRAHIRWNNPDNVTDTWVYTGNGKEIPSLYL